MKKKTIGHPDRTFRFLHKHIQNVSLSFSFFNNTPRTQKCSCIEQWASRTTTSRVSFANWLSSYLRFYTRRLSRSKLQSNLKNSISKISLTIHSPISHSKWYSSERYYSLQSMNSLLQFILSWQFQLNRQSHLSSWYIFLVTLSWYIFHAWFSTIYFSCLKDFTANSVLLCHCPNPLGTKPKKGCSYLK